MPRRPPYTREESEEVSDEQVDEAIRVLRRWYYSRINEIAQDYKKRLDDDEFDDDEDFWQDLDETVDGLDLVIYTKLSMRVVFVSDNDDAYFDETGESLDCQDDVDWAKLAYYAVKADLMQAFPDVGIDVSSPTAESEEEDEDDEGDEDDDGEEEEDEED